MTARLRENGKLELTGENVAPDCAAPERVNDSIALAIARCFVRTSSVLLGLGDDTTATADLRLGRVYHVPTPRAFDQFSVMQSLEGLPVKGAELNLVVGGGSGRPVD